MPYLRPGRRSRFLLGAALALLAGCASAPRPGVVAGSRLGLAKAPAVLPRGVAQLEGGYSHAAAGARWRESIGEPLLRLGVGGSTELRFAPPSYQRSRTAAGAEVEGVGDAYAAVRYRVRDAAGWAPLVSVQVGGTLPVGAGGVGAGQAQPEAALYALWRLPEGVQLLTMGVHRSAVAGDDRFGASTLAAGVRRDVVPGLTAQADYGVVHSTRLGAGTVHQVRGGAAVRLGRNLQLDGWIGRTTANGVHETGFGAGFSRRW